MLRSRVPFLITAFLTSMALSGPGWALDPLLMEIKIKGLTDPGPPELIEQQLLFTYQAGQPVRKVGLRFEHENYAVFHTYLRNQNSLFFYLYEIPPGLTTITYRISVDGLCMPDPANPDQVHDFTGLAFSRVRLRQPVGRPLRNPEISGAGQVSFSLKTEPGRLVSISGNFNHWDPFADRFLEVEPGFYRLTLKVFPGRHYYTFWVDGRRILDPYNLESIQDAEGFRVSTFYLPP